MLLIASRMFTIRSIGIKLVVQFKMLFVFLLFVLLPMRQCWPQYNSSRMTQHRRVTRACDHTQFSILCRVAEDSVLDGIRYEHVSISTHCNTTRCFKNRGSSTNNRAHLPCKNVVAKFSSLLLQK